MLADKSKSKFLYTFWEPDYKNSSLTIKIHVQNTQLQLQWRSRYNFM